MKNKILAIVALAISIGTASASASLVSASDAQFSWTTDTVSGLDWLDFGGGQAPTTIGRSYNDVSQQFSAGGDYEGWRYATLGEYRTFAFHATGITFVGNGSGGEYNGVADGIALYTGYTEDKSPFYRQIFALVGDPGSGGGFRFASQMSHNPPNATDTWVETPDFPDNLASPEVGSWLVRTTAPVPLPGAFWLLVPALGGLGMMRRRAG